MQTDDTLAEAAARGGAEAFAALVDRHYVDCWRYCRQMLGNPSDAEDAVQDAFLRAHRAIGRYRAEASFRAWLFRIVTNACRSAARNQRRRERRVVLNDALVLSAETPNPLGDPDPAIARALATLSSRDREVLALRYGEGMTYAEMSSVLEEGVSALKMRVSRARSALRAVLDGRDD